MLVKKGGISREIDASRLHEYAAKGYAAFQGADVEANRGESEPKAKRTARTAKKE